MIKTAVPGPDFNFLELFHDLQSKNDIIIINEIIHKREKKNGYVGFEPTTSGAWRTDGRTDID